MEVEKEVVCSELPYPKFCPFAQKEKYKKILSPYWYNKESLVYIIPVICTSNYITQRIKEK